MVKRASGAVVVLLLLAPVASPQASPRTSYADPAGDVRDSQGVGLDGSALDYVDLRRLDIAESDANTISFTVAYASDQEPPEVPLMLQRVLRISFMVGQQSFQLHDPYSTCPTAALVIANGGMAGCIASTTSANETTYFIPRALLFDERGTPLVPGATLAQLQAHAAALVVPWPRIVPGVASIYAEDFAPDAAVGAHQVILGGRTDPGSPVRLASEQPLRASNGIDGVFVYPLTIENQGGLREVHLKVTDDADALTAFVPPRISLDGDAQIPVVIATRFTHQHGERQTVLVAATDAAGRALGSEIEFGVQWLATPQPSGHHPVLYIHKGEAGEFDQRTTFHPAWVNAMEEDMRPGASQDATPATWDDVTVDVAGQSISRNAWKMPLDPGLLLGLTLDPLRQGSFLLDVEPPAGAVAGSIDVSVSYCPEGNDRLGCTPGGTALLTGGAAMPSARALVEVPLASDTNQTHWAFRAGANLFLDIVLSFSPPLPTIAETAALLHPSSSRITLPLGEYRDPFEDPEFDNGLRLRHEELLRANPGDAGRIEFLVGSDVDAEATLMVAGPAAEWFANQPPVLLKAGVDRQITLEFTVPADAFHGQAAPGMAVLYDEAGRVRLSRFHIEVVDPAVEDLPSQNTERVAKDSPLPVGLAPLVAGLLFWRRRRGDS